MELLTILKMKNPDRKNFIAPTKSLIKRIDIGLFTGMLALLIAFLTIQMEKETQKASVLPIIQVDMGYQYKTAPYSYKITLTNSGPGIAYVQNVQPLIEGKPVSDHNVLQDALMNGRMFGNSKLEEQAAAGFLSPGNSVTPWSFTWGRSHRGEIEAYLRGVYGPPMKGVDLKVCYCSVFDDCWTVLASDINKPKPVKLCGKNDQQDDFFQATIATRAAEKLETE